MPKLFKDPNTRWRDAGADFIKSEVSGGVVLLIAAITAVVWANSPWNDSYFDFWQTDLTLGFGEFSKTESLQYWVNDLLMVLFFFVVGLEIKRELAVGELNDRSRAMLPLIAALGGVILPGIIFLSLNMGTAGEAGWAIPMATDIAFAVAVLALLGKRIPSGVRLLLLSVAIIDDVIAILIIAIFYSKGVSLMWLGIAALSLLVVFIMQRTNVNRIGPYWVIGAVVWVAFLSSGVHATIAGVILGLMTPAKPISGFHVIEHLEHRLHPWTSMVIVPIFALANAGIVISAAVLTDATGSTVFWGIAFGLVAGKVLGIGTAISLARRFGWGTLPSGVQAAHVWGVAALGGIGFTVSLFIAQLAYTSSELLEFAKLGIFTGSLVSAIIGVIILLRASKRPVGEPIPIRGPAAPRGD